VANGLPTSALLAHVAVSKFAWHIPLHRQTQMMAASGVQLDRSTLVHWIERAAWWLWPLHALLTESVLSAPKIFCDDLPVLDRTRRRTRLGRIWCYAVDDRPRQGPMPPAVVYLFAEDRRGCRVAEHLDTFSGVLQVDAYAAYDALARGSRNAGPIRLAYCLAHARRRFFDLHKTGNEPVATEAVRRIGKIYEIEAHVRGTTADIRAATRRRETKPLMETFKSWLMERLEEISAKSKHAEAIRYALGHWDGLTLFLEDGRVEMGRVEVWRGCCRLNISVAVPFVLRCLTGPTLAPSPHPARQTGHADFPHPAFSRSVRPLLSAGRRVAVEPCRGRVSRRDTRLGSGGTQRLGVPSGASTSGGFVVLCMPERAHRFL
jgi:transposase